MNTSFVIFSFPFLLEAVNRSTNFYCDQEDTSFDVAILRWYPYIFNSQYPIFFLQFSSVTQSCPTLCHPMDCSTPGLPVHHQLPECTQTPVHQVGDASQPSHPLLSPSLPAFNISQHQGFFSNESVLCIRWSKYWSFSFSISPSNEYSELISFRIN